jgi:hypothetical protein
MNTTLIKKEETHYSRRCYQGKKNMKGKGWSEYSSLQGKVLKPLTFFKELP